jgi:epoxyqueuosine reductase
VTQSPNNTVKLSSKSSDALPSAATRADIDFAALTLDIKRWGQALGFQQVGITGTDLSQDEAWLLDWLDQDCHGEMSYMHRHGVKRSRPQELLPGTTRIISVRMDYWPAQAEAADNLLADPLRAYLSRYALGRDYHKVLRGRLQKLATRIEQKVGAFGYRAYTDSAPVLEKAIARNAGLGWIGKHTNLIDERGGSWFFLGELFTDLPLPLDRPARAHCGTCQACMDICPTQAIVAPYRLDARRCISYLTIELRGPIPEALRPLLGNRIYGCDDCQLACPWNRFAAACGEADFAPRHGLDSATLVELFGWDEPAFLANTAGTAIRRIGHECWLRNIAVALGNAPHDAAVVAALEARRDDASALVREHVAWALQQQARRR